MSIEKVNDATFAQKILGDGVAIAPSRGKICAPVDGTVEMVMDTKHALAIRTQGGTGLLIHIGIDTVNLQGKYFNALVKEGDIVKTGQCLVEFDKEKIQAEGYDTTTCLIITEPLEGHELKTTRERNVRCGEKIAEI